MPTMELFTGYTPYFSFLTGFEPIANIASTTLTNLGPSGYRYTVTFVDGSRVEFGLNEGGVTDATPPNFDNLVHYTFATSGGFRILDNHGLSAADAGAVRPPARRRRAPWARSPS